MKIFLIIILNYISISKKNGKVISKSIKNRKLNDEFDENIFNKIGKEKEKINHWEKLEYITQKFGILSDKYKDCLFEHNEETIEDLKEKCLGVNYSKIDYDVEYEIMRVMSKNDLHLRSIFIDNCYKIAGLNTTFSDACDYMEKDTLDLLWRSYNVPDLLEINKINYIDDMNNLPIQIFQILHDHIKDIYSNFDSLMKLINTHTDMLYTNIKRNLEEVSQKPHYKNAAHTIKVKSDKNIDNSAEIDILNDQEKLKKNKIKEDFSKSVAIDIINNTQNKKIKNKADNDDLSNTKPIKSSSKVMKFLLYLIILIYY